MKKIKFLIILNVFFLVGFSTYLFINNDENLSNNIPTLIIVLTPLVFMLVRFKYLVKINEDK